MGALLFQRNRSTSPRSGRENQGNRYDQFHRVQPSTHRPTKRCYVWQHPGRLQTTKSRRKSNSINCTRKFNRLPRRCQHADGGHHHNQNGPKQHHLNTQSKIYAWRYNQFLLGDTNGTKRVHATPHCHCTPRNHRRIQF
jgi:hypothetical protein